MDFPDRLISGARIFDGKKFLNHLNVGIKAGRISYVGTEQIPARRLTDATGYLLTPGFIDTHSHADFHITHPHNDGVSSVSQGVSTLIVGNCGLSATPVTPPHALLLPAKGDENVAPVDQPARLDAGLPLNVADLMGHNTLRIHTLGRSGVANPRQIDKMSGILEDFLAQGGLGLSVGLNYPEAAGTTEKELSSLCKVLAKFDRPLTCHIRDQGAGLAQAAEEVLRLGDQSGCKVLISHLRPSLKRNEHLLDQVLNRIEQNERFKFDLYPYPAGFSNLAWLFQHLFGRLPEKTSLLDPKTVEERSHEVCGKGLEDIYVLRHQNEEWIGSNIVAISSRLRERPGIAAQSIYLDDPGCLCIYDHESTDKAVEKALSHADCFIGSDGYLFSSGDHPPGHPRSFAAFTRFMVRFVQNGRVSLAEALYRMTQAPAEYFNLKGSGVIREGAFANVNLFRLEDLKERAGFKQPWLVSQGMREVMIAGQTVFKDGKTVNNPNYGRRITP